MPVIIDGTTGITTPGETNTGNLSVAGTTALTVPLPIASGGTGTTSTTFTNLASNVTGVLPIANGGTGSAMGVSLRDPFVKYDSLITLPDSIVSSITANTVKLTATTELIFLQGTTNIQAIVWDDAAKSFGTPVLVRTVSSGLVAANLISSTSVLMCSLSTGTTALETVVLSISGTTITVNTPVATTLAATAGFPNNFISRMTKVGSSYVIHYVENTTNTNNNYRAITVSGTVPTIGSQVTYSGGGGLANISNVAYSSSIFLTILASTSILSVQAISVSGTTLTTGTAASTSTTGGSVTSGVFASGRVCIIYLNTTWFATSALVTGTTVTLATGVNTQVAVTSGPALQIVGNQAFVADTTVSNGSAINVITDTAGVITVGTPTTQSNLCMFGFDGTNIYASQCSSSAQIFSFNIVGGSPTMNNFWGGATSTTTNFANNFGAYNINYANTENAGGFKTVSGKYSVFPPTNQGFVLTFDTTNGPLIVFSAVSTSTGINGSVLSSLNRFSGYSFNSNISANTKLKARRIELN